MYYLWHVGCVYSYQTLFLCFYQSISVNKNEENGKHWWILAVSEEGDFKGSLKYPGLKSGFLCRPAAIHSGTVRSDNRPCFVFRPRDIFCWYYRKSVPLCSAEYEVGLCSRTIWTKSDLEWVSCHSRYVTIYYYSTFVSSANSLDIHFTTFLKYTSFILFSIFFFYN